MLADKVLEQISGSFTGTGAYTLDGAVGAYDTWRSEFASASKGLLYIAQNADGTIWELGYGELTYGPPDTLSRTLLKSSTGSLINWQIADAPIYVYSPQSNTVARFMAAPFVNGVTNVPGWLQKGMSWLDYAIGLSTAWVKRKYIGGTLTTAANHIDEGQYYIGPAIFAASQRAFYDDKGAASYTFTADDIGKVLAFDCSSAVRVLTMLANDADGMGHGAYVYVLPYGSDTNGVTFTPGGTDTTDLAEAPPKRLTKYQWDGAKNTWRADYSRPSSYFMGVRQTVSTGPIDSSGLPSFLPSSAASLSITSQNLSASSPLWAVASNGWNSRTGQPFDRFGSAMSNVTWSGLSASTTCYLYLIVNADGSVTPGVTTLVPIYQMAGTPAVTNGQFTFNIGEMKGYLGNGSTAPQAYVVFVGEAVTSGSAVTAATPYAYNGRYDSGYTATLPTSTQVSKNHNIGAVPRLTDWRIRCNTTDQNYAVGDELGAANVAANDTTPIQRQVPLSAGTKAMTLAPSSSWVVINKSSGGGASLAAAKWDHRFIADRGW